jgi:Fe-S-cluster containining protein
MSKMLPMVPMLPKGYVPKDMHRPVDPKWTCQKFGECCTIPKEVVMTKEEMVALVHAAPPTITLHFRPCDEKGDFVALKAAPCPLYVFHTCLVYESRPFNCRRFGCMRPDTQKEPFERDGANMKDRTETSRVARRMAIRMQTKAQKWAYANGWKRE